jgi:F-type H+-transporting ATPase subunit b
MLLMNDGSGGLFDFNGTLPLMALQFILLTIVLTFIFYKPVARAITAREFFINSSLGLAATKIIKTEEVNKQYDEQIKMAKVNAQLIITRSEKNAVDEVARDIEKAFQTEEKYFDDFVKSFGNREAIILRDIKKDELCQLLLEKILTVPGIKI